MRLPYFGKKRGLVTCLAAFVLALLCILDTPTTGVKAAESFSEPDQVSAQRALQTLDFTGEWKDAGSDKKSPAYREVPILLYHSIAGKTESGLISRNVISVEQFDREMKYLTEQGFHAVTFDQMIAYVEKGTPLPQKPVCITFDDGYLSNYKFAYPILKKNNLKATIFVIGATVGQMEFYKDTQFPITPHFTYEQAKEMSDSGVVSIQSHTYDMHQYAPYESGPLIRQNILKLPLETEEEYTELLQADFARSREGIEAATGKAVNVLSYPGGSSDLLSQKILTAAGVKVTLSIREGKAVLNRGIGSSLYNLKRFYVTPQTTEEKFAKWMG